jgi:hypothetical protein
MTRPSDRTFDRVQRRIRRGIESIVGTPPGLLDIFEKDIRAEHIVERLSSCRPDSIASEVRARMEQWDFDVLGVQRDGYLIEGYVLREDLTTGCAGDHCRPFPAFELAAESMPLLDVLRVMRDQERLFVVVGNSVWGIITRGDLQKAPVRLLLFGLITSLESQMLGMIRHRHPGEAWTDKLSGGRVGAARLLLQRRQARNEAIDLADCLQLCDKREILTKDAEMLKHLGFSSRRQAIALFERVEALRDRLAHSQDLIAGSSWAEVVDLTDQMDALLHGLATRPALVAQSQL